jgi:hypothetical protein
MGFPMAAVGATLAFPFSDWAVVERFEGRIETRRGSATQILRLISVASGQLRTASNWLFGAVQAAWRQRAKNLFSS